MSGKSTRMWQTGWACFWSFVLVAAWATTIPTPWLLTAIGLGCGGLIGHVRSHAIAMGKRTALATVLAWACGIGLLILAMAFAEDMFVGAWAAGVAGCLLLDSLHSLWARHRAQRASIGDGLA